jgi:hypothetical protein
VQPFWKTNPAYFHYLTAAGTPVIGGQQDFRWDYELVPLAWIGCRGCDGLGARARWWKYDQSASETFNDIPGTGVTVESAAPLGLAIRTGVNNANPQSLNLLSDLEVLVIDLEATQEVETGCWWLTFSAGGRYCHVSQDYTATRFNETTLRETLLSSHTFNGMGLTAAIEGHRPLGLLGLSLYASTRGSLLYGRKEQAAFLDSTTDLAARYDHEDVLPEVEMEIGFEWRGEVGCCQLFVQTAVVGQAWFGIGNASRTSAATSTITPFRGAPVDDAMLGFFGGTLQAGVKF